MKTPTAFRPTMLILALVLFTPALLAQSPNTSPNTATTTSIEDDDDDHGLWGLLGLLGLVGLYGLKGRDHDTARHDTTRHTTDTSRRT